MKYLVFFLLLLLSYFSFSQNLVLNGSFEDSEKCAEDLQQFDKNVKYWNIPTSGSTDLFNDCTEFEDLQPLNNYQGSQATSDGQNYAGCYFYGIDDYREYIQGSLSESLIIGNRYKISFKISLADKSDMAIKEIQVMLTDSIIKSWGTIPITKNRIRNKKIKNFTLEIISDDYFSDKEHWIELSTEFIATESANYLTIGNFKSNKLTKKKKQKFFPKIKKAYYFIDNVKLISLETKSSKEELVNDIIIEKEDFKLNKTYTLQNVRFQFDSTILVDESLIELDELFKYLANNKETRVTINGHTDNQGSEEYNFKLSTDRALSIKKYLVQKGIQKARIFCKGYGETQRLKLNDNEESHAQNRRVEFIITK